MGDTKRKRSQFSRPRKVHDKARMEVETALVREYGLKNKREIWRVSSKVSTIRRRSKLLIGENPVEQQKLFAKLQKLGLNTTCTADVLALTSKDLFERRLQTMVFRKKLANTPGQARQLIVHKHVMVGDQIVNSPSFWVTKDLENKISLVNKPSKEKVSNEEATE